MRPGVSVRRIVALLSVFLIGACGGDGPIGPSRPALITFNFLTPATVASVIVEISGPGIEPSVTLNIPVGPDSVARDTVSVSAGSGRRITVTAVDTAGIQTHRADTTVMLVSGANPSMSLRLIPLSSTLGITVTFGGVSLAIDDTTMRVMPVGDTLRIGAALFAPSGLALPGDSIAWGSSNPAIASVDAGLVRAVRAGSAVITASYRGATARVRIEVASGSLPAGLIAFYEFDGTLTSSVGAPAEFTNSGGVFVSDRIARLGSAISFPSLSSGAQRQWSDFPADSFTVSMWVRIEGQALGTGYHFFLWGSNPVSATPGVRISLDENWVARGCSSSESGYALVTRIGSTDVPALLDPQGCLPYSVISTWRHVAVSVRNGAGRVYVDGELESAFAPPAPIASTNATVFLGISSNASGVTARQLDSFAVWGRVLTDGEVRAVFLSTR